MDADKATHLPNWREPVVGEEVCVGSSFFLSRGRDDFCGGMARISKIRDERDSGSAALINRLMVVLEENPGTQHNWYHLIEEEPENLERHGDQRAHLCPDHRPEFVQPSGRLVSGAMTVRVLLGLLEAPSAWDAPVEIDGMDAKGYAVRMSIAGTKIRGGTMYIIANEEVPDDDHG